MQAPNDALDFVRVHGIVLICGRGPVPTLVDAIAQERVRGSWWAHPDSRHIFHELQRVCDAPEVLVCRLVQAKLTLVHRRLWAALVCAADSFNVEHLAQVRQQHSASGRHVNRELPFPLWVTAQTLAEARELTPERALGLLGEWAAQGRPVRTVAAGPHTPHLGRGSVPASARNSGRKDSDDQR